MKIFGKWLAVCLSIAMLTVGLAGCNSGSGDNSSTTGASKTTGTDSSKADGDYDLVEKGKLIMGTNAYFPPFEMIEGGEVVGVDAELMAAVADKLGLEFSITDMEFDSLSGALTSRKIDVIAAGFTVRPDREEVMDFSDSYYTARQTIIVKTDSDIAAKDDLADKKIGVQTGTSGNTEAEGLANDKDNVRGFSTGALAVEALLNGDVDAVIIDNNPAKEYADQNSSELKLIEGQFEDEAYAVAVLKGNKTLLDAINKAMKELKDDGTFQQIVDKYIK